MKTNKIWFKAKMYGWGWQPQSWEGWLVLTMYLVAVILHLRNVDKFAHSASDVLINFSIPFTFLLSTDHYPRIAYLFCKPAKFF